MAQCKFILPRIKEAFSVLKDIADHDSRLIDRDTLNHVFVNYELDKVWRK